MRGLLLLVATIMAAAPGTRAQPADCATLPSSGASVPVGIDVAGQPGVAKGVTGRAYVPVPLQAPRTDCGEPSVPGDVLRGPPGDVLLGPTPDSARP